MEFVGDAREKGFQVTFLDNNLDIDLKAIQEAERGVIEVSSLEVLEDF